MAKWRFSVIGRLVGERSGEPLVDRELIIESGVQDEGSAFRTTGVGPIARSTSDGSFESWFITQGTDGPVVAPAAVKVVLEVGPGGWRSVEVIAPAMRAADGSRALLDLGSVRVDEEGAYRWSK